MCMKGLLQFCYLKLNTKIVQCKNHCCTLSREVRILEAELTNRWAWLLSGALLRISASSVAHLLFRFAQVGVPPLMSEKRVGGGTKRWKRINAKGKIGRGSIWIIDLSSCYLMSCLALFHREDLERVKECKHRLRIVSLLKYNFFKLPN